MGDGLTVYGSSVVPRKQAARGTIPSAKSEMEMSLGRSSRALRLLRRFDGRRLRWYCAVSIILIYFLPKLP